MALPNFSQINSQEQPNQVGGYISKKYQTLAYAERMRLIELVQKEGFSVYRASRMLGINNSTAKVILRQFRRQGHVFKKKSERIEQRQQQLKQQQGQKQQQEEPLPRGTNRPQNNESGPINQHISCYSFQGLTYVIMQNPTLYASFANFYFYDQRLQGQQLFF